MVDPRARVNAGYRAEVTGDAVTMALGYSHTVVFSCRRACGKVGRIACASARIRVWWGRPPPRWCARPTEPYRAGISRGGVSAKAVSRPPPAVRLVANVRWSLHAEQEAIGKKRTVRCGSASADSERASGGLSQHQDIDAQVITTRCREAVPPRTSRGAACLKAPRRTRQAVGAASQRSVWRKDRPGVFEERYTYHAACRRWPRRHARRADV